MRKPRMLIIDPSIVWPEDEGVREIVGDWPGDHRVLRPVLHPGDGPGPSVAYDAEAVVVMGSRASVNDDSPWLADLAEWLRPLVDGSHPRPVLGICFGHQLIAHCSGGRVSAIRRDRSEERGVKETLFDRCQLTPEGGTLKVIASHGEAVEKVPDGYRVVARREHVAVDAMEHETLPIFSVQFHPEARGKFLAARDIPPSANDAVAFADQARLLARFRTLAMRFRNGS